MRVWALPRPACRATASGALPKALVARPHAHDLDGPPVLLLQPGGLECFRILGRLPGEDGALHAHHSRADSSVHSSMGGIAAIDERVHHAGDARQIEGLLNGRPLVLADEHDALAPHVGDRDGCVFLVGLGDDVVEVLAQGGCI